MKNKLITLLLAFVLVFSIIPCIEIKTEAAAIYNPNVVIGIAQEYANTGATDWNNLCLGFVNACFNRAYGYVANYYSCCAYNYGTHYLDNTSRDNIPIGADVFFGGSSIVCSGCGNNAGHVGIYIGDGYIIHSWSGKVQKSSIDYVVNCGYPYRGYGWHGDLIIENSPSSAGDYLYQCTFQKSYCDIEVTVETTLKTLPCSKATDERSETIRTSPVGETLTAIGLYKNTAGNWWYKVDLGNEIGYVFSGSTKLLQYNNGAYISNPVAPEALNVGDRFSIQGVVSSDLTELKQVAGLIMQDGNTLYQSYEDLSGGVSYNLLNSKVDMGLLFNELAEGRYIYQIYVREDNSYANGTELYTERRWPAVYTKEFKVGNPPDSGSGDSGTDIPVTSVVLLEESHTLTQIGASYLIPLSVLPDNATNKTVAWIISNPAVATVDQSGKVTAIGNGTCSVKVITADGDFTDTMEITVKVPANGISLDTTSKTLTSLGSTTQLTATILPATAANKAVTWRSSNPAVATVNANGLVTAVANGSCTITATAADGGFTDSCDIIVLDTSAEYTDGYYTYTVFNGEATITAVDTAISGNITIPGTLDGYPVVAIGDDAFYTCSNITSITIPHSITSIGDYAFIGAKKLESITVSAENTAYKDISGVLYTYDGKTFVCYPAGKTAASFTIPSGVTTISSYAFYQSRLTSIIIPRGVTSIGAGAFQLCSNLANIVIPNSITSIGNQAFFGCSSLTSLTIPNSVTSIERDTFLSCTKLTIYAEAASKPSVWHENWNSGNCSVIWGYDIIPVTKVVTKYNTYTMESIGETYLISYAVEPLNATTQNVIWSSSDTSVAKVDADGLLTAVGKGTCSITVTTIDGGFTYTMEVTIPDDAPILQTFGYYKYTVKNNKATITKADIAISGDITIPATLGGYPVVEIGHDSFYNCQKLTGVVIPAGVTTINNTAFNSCYNLTSIMIPDSVTDIGIYAFLNCQKLSKIIIPSSVQNIGIYAFRNCSNLTIYAEVASKPSGWDTDWNDSDRPVIWGYTAATGVTLDKDSVTLTSVGGTAQLTATVLPSTATNKAVTWTSSIPAVATVDQSGKVTAVANGTCTITVTTADGGFTDTCAVTVNIPQAPPVDPTAPTLTVNTVEARPGEPVTVTVDISNNPGFGLLVLGLNYENRYITLTNVENNATELDFDNALNLVWLANEAYTQNGAIMTLTFNVAEDAPEETYKIWVECHESYNDEYEDMTWNCIAGGITIKDILYGDVNGDGKVNGADLLMMRRFIANYNYSTGQSTIAVKEGADANGDGKTNGADLLLMRRYIANYNYSTGESTVVLGPKQ